MLFLFEAITVLISVHHELLALCMTALTQICCDEGTRKQSYDDDEAKYKEFRMMRQNSLMSKVQS